MTARFVLSRQAKQDLADIAEYIAEESGPDPAEYVVEKIRETFRFLAEQPGVGHVREDLAEDPAVRFWAVFSYLIAYVPDERPLGVVCIVHGSRDPGEIARHLRRARSSHPEDE